MGYGMNQQPNATQDSREKTTSTWQNYVVMVTEIVLKVRRLSGLPQMMSIERDKIVNDWVETLWQQIPYESLYASYLAAIRKHRDGPFRPGHIIAEWMSQKASLPVIQTQCLFCPRFLEDPSAPESCADPCPFHSVSSEVTH